MPVPIGRFVRVYADGHVDLGKPGLGLVVTAFDKKGPYT
jgi:hypothetical protein